MLIFLGVVAALVGAVYLYLTWNYGYWEKHGIPHEKPKFFFGNIKEALTGKKHFGLIYNDLYKKFNNAAYFGLYKLRIPILVVRDPDIIKDVLVKEYQHFHENDFHTDTKKDPILNVNPFFHAGDDWKMRRAQWSAGLTLSKVKTLYETMEPKAAQMVEYVNKQIDENPGEPMEARELAIKYLTDTMVNGVLGLKSNTFEDENNVFKRISLSLFVSDFWEGLANLAYIVAPWIHSFLPIGFVKPWVKDECVDIAKNIVAIRKEHGFMKNDFFESLMKDENVNILEIAGRVFGYLSEGVETSSGLVGFTLFELASDPQVQAKLRKELNNAAAQHGGKLTYEDIVGCKYLDMITSETMRLYPAVLAINRLCTKSFELPPAVPGGKPFKIPVGTPVTICNYATHNDPQYFPDPSRFDPERFASEDTITKFTYLPFGEGPRICVGLRLGLTNGKNAIAHLVRNFEMRVAPKTLPRPLPLDPNVLVARAVGNIWLTFHKVQQ